MHCTRCTAGLIATCCSVVTDPGPTRPPWATAAPVGPDPPAKPPIYLPWRATRTAWLAHALHGLPGDCQPPRCTEQHQPRPARPAGFILPASGLATRRQRLLTACCASACSHPAVPAAARLAAAAVGQALVQQQAAGKPHLGHGRCCCCCCC